MTIHNSHGQSIMRLGMIWGHFWGQTIRSWMTLFCSLSSSTKTLDGVSILILILSMLTHRVQGMGKATDGRSPSPSLNNYPEETASNLNTYGRLLYKQEINFLVWALYVSLYLLQRFCLPWLLQWQCKWLHFHFRLFHHIIQNGDQANGLEMDLDNYGGARSRISFWSYLVRWKDDDEAECLIHYLGGRWSRLRN